MMKKNDLPSLKIDNVHGEIVECIFHSTPNVKSNWDGVLISSSNQFIWGRFVSVDGEKLTCSFFIESEKGIKNARAGDIYHYLDGYWGERAELIYDKSIRWELKAFVASDAVFIAKGQWRKRNEDDKDSEVIPKGWDHEHCEICMETISPFVQPKGYFDGNDKWLCITCFEKYLVKEDLSFIEL